MLGDDLEGSVLISRNGQRQIGDDLALVGNAKPPRLDERFTASAMSSSVTPTTVMCGYHGRPEAMAPRFKPTR